ncbi:MAG: hypothetical protein ACRYF4_05680 [Janthinobacterium lividum]
MSIQDPTPDPRNVPYGQQPYGTPASSAYKPVTDPVDPAGAVPPVDPYGYSGPGYTSAPPPGAPNPGLAALLGFIPGVGAMYNGQFPKGIAHIAIFAVFSSLSKNVNGFFGLFVAGWVFYMVFEAYQTAIARRDGLPLPDPFGLNNIGERFGFRGNPDFSHFWNHGAPPVRPTNPADRAADPYYPPVDPRAQGYQVDPAGNVYRSAATGSAAPGYGPPVPPAAGYPPYSTPPYGGAGYEVPQYAVPPMPPMPPIPRSGLPTGAIVLIGLGVFALLGSMRSFAFLEGEATGGLFLIGLSIFMIWRRFSVSRTLYPEGSAEARWNLLRASKGAGVVFVVGLLTLLQGLHVVDWEYSWPLLLIFLGVFILLERLALNRMNTPAYPPVGYPGAPVPPAAEPVVETASPTSIMPKYTRPSNDLNDTEGR